jgi:5-methylcytosine-specific restriction endonuclease McrA
MNIYTKQRRLRETRSKPLWLNVAQLIEIADMYNDARSRPTKHEVDHILPLYHPLFCGLTVPWNLQVVPEKENRQKGNKHLDGQLEEG